MILVDACVLKVLVDFVFMILVDVLCSDFPCRCKNTLCSQ